MLNEQLPLPLKRPNPLGLELLGTRDVSLELELGPLGPTKDSSLYGGSLDTVTSLELELGPLGSYERFLSLRRKSRHGYMNKHPVQFDV